MSNIQQAMTGRHVLSASEAASILKVSIKQVTRWCLDGTLGGAEKPEGVTAAWMIPAESVAALAEKRRAELLERLPDISPTASQALADSQEVA